jgi:20S proteasome alpha/beta subunit
MASIGNETLIGCSGEYSDFQKLVDILREQETQDWVAQDYKSMTTPEYAHFLSSVLYARRNKGDPYYNHTLVAGLDRGTPYLAYLDTCGTLVPSDYASTWHGMAMAKPFIHNHWRPDLTEAEARDLLEITARILWYRDSSASERIQIGKVDASGVTFTDPYVLQSEWDLESFRIDSMNPLFP